MDPTLVMNSVPSWEALPVVVEVRFLILIDSLRRCVPPRGQVPLQVLVPRVRFRVAACTTGVHRCSLFVSNT